MDEQKNSVINPRDEVEEVAQVISFLGRVIGAVALDDYERVGAQVRAGKSLDQIKAEVKMPEYASYTSQDRMPTNIEAAYRAVKGN